MLRCLFGVVCSVCKLEVGSRWRIERVASQRDHYGFISQPVDIILTLRHLPRDQRLCHSHDEIRPGKSGGCFPSTNTTFSYDEMRSPTLLRNSAMSLPLSATLLTGESYSIRTVSWPPLPT
jgi:hypothetical protein